MSLHEKHPAKLINIAIASTAAHFSDDKNQADLVYLSINYLLLYLHFYTKS